MEVSEVFGLPSAAAANFKGEGIAQRKHDCGGCGRSEVERAGLGGNAGIEEDVAGLSKSRGAAAADGDELCVEALERREEPEQFFGLAAIGESDDDVSGGEHTEIAVN